MKIISLVLGLLVIPILSSAQLLDFELQPEAFSVELNGWEMFSLWAGGMDATTPELCDIDADGDLDYFSGTEVNYYWFFENIGTINSPNFKYISSYFDSLYPICQGTAYYSAIDFCDIDNDGDYDAFLCNGSISLSLNQGNNSQYNFSPPDTLKDQNEQPLMGHHATAVDIDSDGDSDLFSGTWTSGEIRYFENIGTPEDYEFFLVTENWQGIQISQGEGDPCFGDLDADSDLDLLVGTGQGNIYYYENQGSTQIPDMVLITENFNGIDVGEDASPELADIDNDSDLDLLVGRDSGTNEAAMTQGDVYYYENIGTPQNYSFQFITTNYLIFDNANFNRPNLVDIDADEDPDLFTRVGNNILFYRNQGLVNNPSFVYETSTFGDITVPSISTWFCDIDGDDDYDLFCGTAEIPGPPGLYLYINEGTPQNPSYVLYSNDVVPGVLTQSSAIITPVTADIDGDGDFDLFVSDMTDHFYFWENIGTSTNFVFQFQTDNWQNISNGIGFTRYFCFYDIDHDIDLDLFYMGVTLTEECPLIFYRNEGTAQEADMVLEIDDLFPDLKIRQPAPYLVDIDGDRDGDLFVGDAYGGIRFFRNMEMENAHATVVTTSVSGNDIILQWRTVAEADTYKIYYQSVPYFTPSGAPQAVVLPPDTVWTNVNAILEGQKYYRIVVEF